METIGDLKRYFFLKSNFDSGTFTFSSISSFTLILMLVVWFLQKLRAVQDISLLFVRILPLKILLINDYTCYNVGNDYYTEMWLEM